MEEVIELDREKKKAQSRTLEIMAARVSELVKKFRASLFIVQAERWG